MVADLLMPTLMAGDGHRLEWLTAKVTLLQKLKLNNSGRMGQGLYRERAGAVAMAGCLLLCRAGLILTHHICKAFDLSPELQLA